MTLDELKAEGLATPKPSVSIKLLDDEVTIGHHIFLDIDDNGKQVYMTLSEDGRKVPLDDW